MASSAPRRASYHRDAERRPSVKDVVSTRAEKVAFELDQQQQPSPQPIKSIKPKDSDDDNNNQEEDTSAGDDEIRPASPVKCSPRLETKPRPLHDLRKQVAARHDQPLTTARLRNENAVLKLKLVQLGNQHEVEIQGFKQQLVEAAAAHKHVEETLRKHIDELEMRQNESVDKMQKYQAQVDSFQKMLHTLENRTKASSVPKPLPKHPIYPPRRGNGSPVPYGVVKPFAWRQAEPQWIPAPRAETSQGPSMIAVADLESNTISEPPVPASPYALPLPLSATVEQQLRNAVLASGSLFSYCAEVISSKVATLTPPPAPKPNMKVMPVRGLDNLETPHMESMCVPVPHTPTLAAPPEDYTAITIL